MLCFWQVQSANIRLCVQQRAAIECSVGVVLSSNSSVQCMCCVFGKHNPQTLGYVYNKGQL